MQSKPVVPLPFSTGATVFQNEAFLDPQNGRLKLRPAPPA